MSEDTYSLKGFVAYGALSDNNPAAVALLGELSAYSMTFAKDRLLFSANVATSPASTVGLTVFSSKAIEEGPVPVPAQYSDFLLAFSSFCYSQARAGAFTDDPLVFRQAVQEEFGLQIDDVVVGVMKAGISYYLPESVTFYLLPLGLADAEDYDEDALLYLNSSRVKLWFSDDAFRRQYDEYHIEFIAPLPVGDLDDFFGSTSSIEDAVGERTTPELMQQVAALAATNPYTVLRSDNYDFHDPDVPMYRLPTTWTFLIWGPAGNNIDAIRQALIDWILDNSTHTSEEWAEIFPDIFTATEYVITPMWQQYAVPNMTIEMGVYSPIVNHAHALEVALKTTAGLGYDVPHITENLSVFGAPFKSIALLACGGPDNRYGIKQIEKQWSDYMAVSTTSLDFGRMQPATQQFVNLLAAMLLVAETMTDVSDIPVNMSRLVRTNSDDEEIMYVVSSFKNIEYLVAARNSVHALFPPAIHTDLQITCEGVVGVAAMPNGTIGTPYSVDFAGLGGSAPYTYAKMSTKPDDFLTEALDPVTGVYTATFDTDAEGDYDIIVKVTDDEGSVKTTTFTLNVAEAPGP